MILLSFCIELFSQLNDRRHIQVIPLDFAVAHPVIAAVKAATQMGNNTFRMASQKLLRVSVELPRPEAHHDTGLTGNTELVEIVVDMDEDVTSFLIGKDRITPERFAVKRHE